MLKVIKQTYSKDGKKVGRTWEIYDDSDKLVKTVFFGYNESGQHPTCFYISEADPRFAVVINNEDYDLMCFALDYNPESVLYCCEDHLKFYTKHWSESGVKVETETLSFDDEDKLLDIIT